VYGAYVPSFAVSYDCLGDQEAYSLKYIWELTIYFAFYVFPMINDLFTDKRFLVSFLQRFSRLGRVNAGLQAYFSAFFHWKKDNKEPHREPMFVDFYETGGLGVAEKAFYEVGLTTDQARDILDRQLQNTFYLARQSVAHVYASVLGDTSVFWNKSFIESLDLERLRFDPEEMRRHYSEHAECRDRYEWPMGWKPDALVRLMTPRRVRSVEGVAV
jgi:hypothetical protein